MDKTQWGNIRIRQDLIDRISKILNSEDVKREGFSNIAQFTDYTLRESIKELEKTGFKSVTIKENVIEIFDENLGENGKLISIHQNKNKLNCLECNSKSCIHINYIWSIEHIASELEGNGFERTEKICPKCGVIAKEIQIEELFGYRKIKDKIFTQSHCKNCRNKNKK